MPNKSKKGQAQIIVTVLTILLVIAAIAIVAISVMNVIRDRTGEADNRLECLKIGLSVERALSGESSVVIKMDSGEINSVNVTTIIDAASTGTTKARNSTGKLLNKFETVNLTLDGVLSTGDRVNAIASFVKDGETINCGVLGTKVV